MLKYALAGAVALAIGGSTLVYAQSRGDGHRHFHFRGAMNSQDRSAMLDARIAAVHAGLKLSPDQDKNWPAVESAVRDLIKGRADQRDARRAARPSGDQPLDPLARLRARADEMAATAAGMKRVADAADPLFKSLDDGQKRRLALLTRMGMRGRMMEMRDRFMDRMGGDDRRDGDRGQRDRERPSRGQDRDDGPHRL